MQLVDGTMLYEYNPNGVLGRYIRFEWNHKWFVPLCCLKCKHYDYGELGEYGSWISGPYCMKNVWFPIKKGTCKKQNA